QAMQRALRWYGVPERDVTASHAATRTFDDPASLTSAPGEGLDLDQATFVTSGYHTFRVRKMLDHLKIRGRVVAAFPSEEHPAVWSVRMDNFREIVREYLAIIYYWLRGVLVF
ncbi:MAG: YdcF family protein, partial [Magnetococcales bacterium]|nr:YdcF family protein [Magnetococcales bacterium]